MVYRPTGIDRFTRAADLDRLYWAARLDGTNMMGPTAAPRAQLRANLGVKSPSAARARPRG
jgi:hypothetical protein